MKNHTTFPVCIGINRPLAHAGLPRSLLFSALLFAVAPGTALAQGDAYPSRPITIISTFSAGSGPDAMMRAVAEKVAQTWKQPVVIDNRPGGAGFIAINAAKAAAPDGYTLLMHDGEALSALPYLYKNRQFKTFDTFAPVAALYGTPFLVAVSATSKWKSMQDLLAAAKAKPESVSYGTWGVGSSIHLQSLLLASKAGAQMLHVPYKEMSQLYTGVGVDDVTWSFGGLASTQFAYKAGKLRYLAVAAPKRIAQMPEVPTIAESGGPADVHASAFVALLAPKATPAAITAKVNDAMRKAVADPDIVARYANFSFDAIAWSPAELQRAMEDRAVVYEQIIRQNGIVLE